MLDTTGGGEEVVAEDEGEIEVELIFIALHLTNSHTTSKPTLTAVAAGVAAAVATRNYQQHTDIVDCHVIIKLYTKIKRQLYCFLPINNGYTLNCDVLL